MQDEEDKKENRVMQFILDRKIKSSMISQKIILERKSSTGEKIQWQSVELYLAEAKQETHLEETHALLRQMGRADHVQEDV